MLYHLIETELGWVGISGAEGSISRLELPVKTREVAESLFPAAVPCEDDFSGVAESLREYLSGKHVEFDCELTPDTRSEFDKTVWSAAREIPYGGAETYTWIADRIGRPKAARAVGQALGRNPIPIIIPCHRVLHIDGTLGGFSAGLHWKRKLLDMEGTAYIDRIR